MRAYVASGDAYSQFSLRHIISFRLLVSSAGTLHMFAAQSPASFKDSKSTCGEATQIYQTPIAYLKPLNSGRTTKRTNHPQIEVMGCSLPWPNRLPSYIPFLCTTTSAVSSWKSGLFRVLIGEYEELAPKTTLMLYSPDTRSQVWLGCIRRPGSNGITLGIRLGSRELSCHFPRGHFYFQGPVKPPLADTNGRLLFSPEMLKAEFFYEAWRFRRICSKRRSRRKHADTAVTGSCVCRRLSRCTANAVPTVGQTLVQWTSMATDVCTHHGLSAANPSSAACRFLTTIISRPSTKLL
jgi:hypothetical protein